MITDTKQVPNNSRQYEIPSQKRKKIISEIEDLVSWYILAIMIHRRLNQEEKKIEV